ncbi:hypothetical protein F4808DRAFT_222325 [Astrocystis sublimbata]|nr:hypothetical protein F4808DRAFT_222325 [Astrocystis sublimbata]
MSESGLEAHKAPARPRVFIYFAVPILLLSAVVLALAAYAESLSGHFFYESDVTRFLLFVSTWTWLLYGGMLITWRHANRFYYRIVATISQLLSIVFWIIGWAWATASASDTLSFDNYGSYDSIRGHWVAFGQTVAACAGVGAGVWVLCIVAALIYCFTTEPTTTTASEPGSDV